MWKLLVYLLTLFSTGKGICEGECKIDTCTSRTASIFVWKLISSGSKDGTFCRKDDSCVWIFQKRICQEFESLDATAFKKSAKTYECYNMTKKEYLLVRRRAVIQLSKLKNTVGVIIFLPYFGMAIVLLLVIIWIHEEAEGLWTICKYRHIAGRLKRKKILKKSQTMIRYDDCDICIKTISSSLEEPKSKESRSKNFGNGRRMPPNGHRIQNLDKLNESSKTIKEMSNSSCKFDISNELDIQIPKLVAETQGINSKQAPLMANNFFRKSSTGVPTTNKDKCIESSSIAMMQDSETSERIPTNSKNSLAHSYCKECTLKILKCDYKTFQKTEKDSEETTCVKVGEGEESKLQTDVERKGVLNIEDGCEEQLEKGLENREDVQPGKEHFSDQ